MQKHFYTKEKLNNAIYCLATGAGDVRNRLLGAFLAMHTLREEDFPEKLRKDWIWIKRQLTKYESRLSYDKRGTVEYTLSKIKNKTGAKIAQKIYAMKTEIDLIT